MQEVNREDVSDYENLKLTLESKESLSNVQLDTFDNRASTIRPSSIQDERVQTL